jgi:hypothetical protein
MAEGDAVIEIKRSPNGHHELTDPGGGGVANFCWRKADCFDFKNRQIRLRIDPPNFRGELFRILEPNYDFLRAIHHMKISDNVSILTHHDPRAAAGGVWIGSFGIFAFPFAVVFLLLLVTLFPFRRQQIPKRQFLFIQHFLFMRD